MIGVGDEVTARRHSATSTSFAGARLTRTWNMGIVVLDAMTPLA